MTTVSSRSYYPPFKDNVPTATEILSGIPPVQAIPLRDRTRKRLRQRELAYYQLLITTILYRKLVSSLVNKNLIGWNLTNEYDL